MTVRIIQNFIHFESDMSGIISVSFVMRSVPGDKNRAGYHIHSCQNYVCDFENNAAITNSKILLSLLLSLLLS